MNKKPFKEYDEFNIRRSQLIVPFGVGSILNMLPNESLMLCGLDDWNEKFGELLTDERLQRHLGVKYFRGIPITKKENPKGLPFVRFPKWYYCPLCERFKPLSEWKKNWFEYYHSDFDHPRCFNPGCKGKLLNPSRFIIACRKGHIDDFPWIEWVHYGNNICSKPDLRYNTGGGTSGLSSIKIFCKKCNLIKTMDGSFDKDAFKKRGFKCTGGKPWQHKREKCEEYPITLQRGASNVYFPKVVSSICIPPYSDDICTKIQDTQEWKYLSSQTGGINDEIKKSFIEKIAGDVNETKDNIRKIIERMLNSSSGDVERRPDVEYRYDEYRALTGDVKTGQIDSKKFEIEIVDGKKYKIKGIKNITLVHRLREIRSLVAFNRIQPIETDYFSDIEEEEEKEKFPSMRIAKKTDKTWLPAVEVNGEGVFFEFGKDKISQWESDKEIQKRVSILQENSDNMSKLYNRPSKNISASFLLLHTFSHVLIRQLSFECGYSIASLRERIYCAEIDDSLIMTGFLIYTAGGDSDGSMGGLVRQGRSDKLGDIIKKAIQKASWCSSDPACIESRGQGLGSLNLAACFACVLLPETSCETGNKFLDRAMLVGLPDKPEIGFFHGVF